MENYEDAVKKITNLILTSKHKMIREENLKTLCKFSYDLDFNKIITNVYDLLKKVGFDLFKREFQGNIYYVLISEGKDDNITPSQYGTLALIIALTKEVNENINVSDLKEIFADVWTSDVKFLIDNDYLRENKEMKIIKVTPLGKAALKNIINDLKIENLLKIFQEE